MAIAVGILILVIITVLFHFLSPWWFTPLAADWSSIDLMVDITFWVTGIVFIALNGFLIWVIIKYRHREGLKAHYEPESKKLEWWLTIVTTVGVIALLAEHCCPALQPSELSETGISRPRSRSGPP